MKAIFAWPYPISIAIATALVLATSQHALSSEDSGPRKELARSSDDSARRLCTLPNCAKVLSIRHPNGFEPPPTIPVQGNIKRDPPFGGQNPHVPPINQPGAVVQKKLDLWLIEVQRRDGSIEVIRQRYPALFQVGDEVLVEGDRIRSPE
jgi:hypothetical protein